MNKEKQIRKIESEQLIEELSKMPPMVIATAYLHAINYTLYGVDVTEKWLTATQQAFALESAHRKGYYDAMQRQAESKEESKTGQWIPVSERLPEPNRLVLCHITTGATLTYFLAFWNDVQNDWEEGIGGYRLLKNDLGYEVIEWMPLPETYQSND